MSANPSAPLSPGDVTNATRAGWAERSLAEFVKQVYRDPDLPTMGIEDVEDAISDLVCDLRHYALRRGFTSNDLDRMFTNAVAMHKSEIEEESNLFAKLPIYERKPTDIIRDRGNGVEPPTGTLTVIGRSDDDRAVVCRDGGAIVIVPFSAFDVVPARGSEILLQRGEVGLDIALSTDMHRENER
jgi:hypothetical protein